MNALIGERAEAIFKKTAVKYEDLVEGLKEKFADDILKLDVRERFGGSAASSEENTVQSRDLWVSIKLPSFRPFVEHLFKYDFVNFHVISGDDTGDNVELNYHLSLFQRARGGRLGVTVSVALPKSDLSIPSIFDLLPGSEYSEREMREMLGIDFVGLPNKALIFLPEDWNEEIKPWRRDETGPNVDIVRVLE
ncbi:hydrogenase [Synergistales bacterium]|nr:hydrogenase [Synergistales bacterium]